VNPYYEEWTESAACRSVGGDVWYPEVGDLTWRDARRICSECPVLSFCRDWVMRTELGLGPKSRHGITAGMSPLQRHTLEPAWLADQEAGAA
jgi:hypothetical protein